MQQGAVIAGRYRLERLIGAGAMGQVWRATDERLDRPVAVKIVDLSQATAGVTRDRFQREIRAAAQLNHPGIVTTLDAGTEGDAAYLVMELVVGESLADKLRRGPLRVDEAAHIGGEVARALEATHAIGIVHRDIKPANVMVDGRSVKVLDFGIALLADETAELTSPRDIIGTAAYMSPEQARGERAGAASDVYSLGCLLVAMLAGRPPFTGPSSLAVAQQQIGAPPPRLRELRPDAPAGLEALVARMLAKDPAQRPDARSVAAALDLVVSRPDADPTAVLSPAATAVLPNPTTVLPPNATTVLPPRQGPAPATARRVDAGGADPHVAGATGAPTRGGGWFRRGLRWILVAIVVLAVLGLLAVLGSRLAANLPFVGGATTSPTTKATTPKGKASPTPDAPFAGPTLPNINLPTITFPTIALPTLPSAQGAALQATLAGVQTTLDSWTPKNAAESDAKQQLTDDWASTAAKITAGKKPQQALSSYTAEVDKLAKKGAIPSGTYAGLSVALRAVAALV